ncbi:acetylcholinesterase activity protein [Paecilomyces lecythidis]
MSLWSRPLAPFEPGNVMDSKDLLQRFVMFSTITEARHALNNIMGKTLGFVRSVQNKCGGLQETMMAKKAVHRRVFDDWLIAFENMMNQPRKYIKTLDPRGPLILRIHHRVALIWLETCPLFDVMSFDNYWDDFEDIVSFASEVIAYNSKVNDSSNKFCLDMEIFPPVYYAAINCRHPLLRRRAIEILSTYHRQECLWEPRERTKVAELVLRIEETRLASLPVEQRIPEARDRVYEPLSSEERVLNPSRITLLFKPNGPNDNWHSETHFVHW